MIKEYHNNENRIFNTPYFMEDLFEKHQKIGFSEAGASNKNGVVERAIKMVVIIARNMLM